MFRTVPLPIITIFFTAHAAIHTELLSTNKFQKLVQLVGFITDIYHDARSPERQINFIRMHKECKM